MNYNNIINMKNVLFGISDVGLRGHSNDTWHFFVLEKIISVLPGNNSKYYLNGCNNILEISSE